MGLAKSRAVPYQLIRVPDTGLDTVLAALAGSTGLTMVEVTEGLVIALNQIGIQSGASLNLNALTVNGVAFPTWAKYQPNIINVTNIQTSSVQEMTYLRLGNFIVYGLRFFADVINPNVASEVGITIPFASNFGLFKEAPGVVTSPDQFGLAPSIRADITNDRFQVQWVAGAGSSNYSFSAIGVMEIIP